MASTTLDLSWSGQYAVDSSQRTSTLPPGDKIILPPSALEGLLSAAATLSSLSADDDDDNAEDNGPSTSTFDPFNPYSFAAERAARAAQQYQRRQQRQQQLPHPLTFRLVNPANERVVYAGIREFSAEEEHIVLSSFLRHALGVEDVQSNHDQDNATGPRITVHAKQLPKGTSVRLRPLEAGYDIEDWKSLLEQHLRTNFTTLTNGEVLTIPGGVGQPQRGNETSEYRFLIDKVEPAGEGICIVDTDLEVDIEPLNEEQARETLQRRLANATSTQNAQNGHTSSSKGGELKIGQSQDGNVQEDQYVDYQITNWDRSKDLEIELDVLNDGDDDGKNEIDLFLSPLSAKQRARPREDEHVFGDFSSRYPKRIHLSSKDYSSVTVEAIWISVHKHKFPESNTPSTGSMKYSIHATSSSSTSSDTSSPTDNPPPLSSHENETQCPNCEQYIPKPTLMLHENFCFRNNILCRLCRQIFKKGSPEWIHHWHCPLCSNQAYGNTPLSSHKHQQVFHTATSCSGCNTFTASNLPDLAKHRVTACPAKLIICRFCHLLVPQGDATEESFLFYAGTTSDLTPHEYTDGARTTDCHICNKIVKLRDLETHLKYHDLERKRKLRPTRCRNENCSRLISDLMGSSGSAGASMATATDTYGLCTMCYGPLYVSMYDPYEKALKRRVERRYLGQLLTGCKNGWCRNLFCRTGREHTRTDTTESSSTGDGKGKLGVNNAPMTAKEASEVAKPYVDAFTIKGGDRPPLHFCVDEQRQKRRVMAEMMASTGDDGDVDAMVSVVRVGDRKGRYALEWCLAALEACQGDVKRAWTWLGERAPTLEEEGMYLRQRDTDIVSALTH